MKKGVLKPKSGEKKIVDRIARIEGQLKGIRRMVAEKKECVNIITQVTAIREAINMLGVELLRADLCSGRKTLGDHYLKTIFKLK
jgi:DNA-binding FrmR family transcriptional regulator